MISGAPVLVAVIVAKQQLDASRKQHRSDARRSLMNYFQALNEIEESVENKKGLAVYHKDFVKQYAPPKIFIAYSRVSSNISNITQQQSDDIIALIKSERMLLEDSI